MIIDISTFHLSSIHQLFIILRFPVHILLLTPIDNIIYLYLFFVPNNLLSLMIILIHPVSFHPAFVLSLLLIQVQETSHPIIISQPSTQSIIIHLFLKNILIILLGPFIGLFFAIALTQFFLDPLNHIVNVLFLTLVINRVLANILFANIFKFRIIFQNSIDPIFIRLTSTKDGTVIKDRVHIVGLELHHQSIVFCMFQFAHLFHYSHFVKEAHLSPFPTIHYILISYYIILLYRSIILSFGTNRSGQHFKYNN